MRLPCETARSCKVLLQPLAVRLLTWVFIIAIPALALTGFYISRPFSFALGTFSLNMRLARTIHLWAGTIVSFAFIIRVYYAIVTGDYQNVIFNREDARRLPGLVRYYLFLTEAKPPQGKYNAAQKLEFTSWAVVLTLEIIKGIILANPARSVWAIKAFGGAPTLRLVGYLGALWFLLTLMVHMYLVFTEDPARLQAIVTGYVKVESPGGRGGYGGLALEGGGHVEGAIDDKGV